MTEDGLGQGLAEDARWLLRFRSAKKLAVVWRRPTRDESAWWDARFGRFADGVHAVAEVEGRRWAVLDRMWHGWPDPPEFAWFALDPDDKVWAARDFDWWPETWTAPPDSQSV